MHALYITHDGLTDHIGQSQVLPYLLCLTKLGFKISIVSAEKSANSFKCDSLALHLESFGIRWQYVSYHNKPPLISTLFDLCRMYWLACKVVCGKPVSLVHCRGHLTTFVGLVLKRQFGIPIIFDFRDFWADRRLISSPYKFAYRFIKRREGWMIRSADHIVTLTEKAKGILQKNYLAGEDLNKLKRFTVIPTCADFNHFDTRHIYLAEKLATRKKLGINSEYIVLGYLGTIAEDYLPEAIFKAFSVLQLLRPNAKFVFVTLTPEIEIKRYAKSYGVKDEDVLIVAASRADVPRYLAIFDLAVVFVRPDLSTAGVSPTKLNELFACNIPVIANSGVGDLDIIINPKVNDSVLVDNFSEKELTKAFEILFTIISKPARHGRENSKQYSLDEGCRRYQSIYSQYFQPERASEN